MAWNMKTYLAVWFFFVISVPGAYFVHLAQSSHFTLKDRFLPGLAFRKLSSQGWGHCLQACATNKRCTSYSFDKQKAPNENCLLYECGFLNECAALDTLIFSKDCCFHQLRPVEVCVNLSETFFIFYFMPGPPNSLSIFPRYHQGLLKGDLWICSLAMASWTPK